MRRSPLNKAFAGMMVTGFESAEFAGQAKTALDVDAMDIWDERVDVF